MGTVSGASTLTTPRLPWQVHPKFIPGRAGVRVEQLESPKSVTP
jgi:hypothetical protein